MADQGIARVIRIRDVITYSEQSSAAEYKLAEASGSLAKCSSEIIRRHEDGYEGIFTIIEPDIPAASGLNEGIIKEVRRAGYEVLVS